ncbi:hypothetical protein BGZ95_002261 [Linnemannia exigua]|uniref:Uncharacterized protein n=1 Tax=Linnemannia exigua TaxID=604196 RepID=A0AAD4D5R9_9FUNG|nr:hypothetical protein BGZ95_002261 [Linnemannia exigua]
MGQPSVVKGFLPWDGNHTDKPMWNLIKNMLNGQHPVGTLYDVTGTWKHNDYPSLGTSRQDIVISSYQVITSNALPPLPPGIVCQVPYGSQTQSAMRSASADQGVSSRGHVQQSVSAATPARGGRRGSVEQDMGLQDGLSLSQDIADFVGHEGQQERPVDFDTLQGTGNLADRRQSLQHTHSQGSLLQQGSNAHRTLAGRGTGSSTVSPGRNNDQRSQTHMPSYLDDVGDEYWNLSSAGQSAVDIILKQNFLEKYGRLNLTGSTSSAPTPPATGGQESLAPGSDLNSDLFPLLHPAISSNVNGKQPLRSDSGSLGQDQVVNSSQWDMSTAQQLWNNPSRSNMASSTGTGGMVTPGSGITRQPLQDISDGMNRSNTAGIDDNLPVKRAVGRPRKDAASATSIKRSVPEIPDGDALPGRGAKRTAFTRSAVRTKETLQSNSRSRSASRSFEADPISPVEIIDEDGYSD